MEAADDRFARFSMESREFWRIMATETPRSGHPKNLSELHRDDYEVLRQVYAARDAYAAEHGRDLDRIYADLKRREMSEPAYTGADTECGIESLGRG